MAQWGIVIGFLGAAIGLCTSWTVLPHAERIKFKYRAPFLVSLVVIGAGVIMQLVAITKFVKSKFSAL